MGKFKPGDKRPPGAGMKKGQKSLKVQAWEELGEYLTNEGATRYLSYIQTLPDEDFAKRYEAMLEYFRPKLQRSSVDMTSNSKELPAPIFIFKDLNE